MALENLFRLNAVLRTARILGVIQDSHLQPLVSGYNFQIPYGLEESLAGMANGRVERIEVPNGSGTLMTHILCPMVVGGVDLGVRTKPESFRPTLAEEDELGMKSIVERPQFTNVMWGIRRK